MAAFIEVSAFYNNLLEKLEKAKFLVPSMIKLSQTIEYFVEPLL